MTNEPNGIERSIGRIEGKLDLMINTITDLKTSFDSLEKGRLTRLEVAFNTLQTEIEYKAKSVATWRALVFSIIASVISAILVATFLSIMRSGVV